jgi:hypothetical protein
MVVKEVGVRGRGLKSAGQDMDEWRPMKILVYGHQHGGRSQEPPRRA